MKYDNVYASSISEEEVIIRTAHCSQVNLQKDVITDNDVENPKTIVIGFEDFKAFMDVVISIGIDLQRNKGIDLGFDIKSEEK